MTAERNKNTSCFTYFNRDISKIDLPQRFTFPFYYEPHDLSKIATAELQERLKQLKLEHNFGLEGDPEGLVIGKMFGVLVVRNSNNELGYISAFSGKLANKNHHPGFVPPVYDMLDETGFFLKGIKELNQLNDQVESLESSNEYQRVQLNAQHVQYEANATIAAFREEMRLKKQERKTRRQHAQSTMNNEEYAGFEQELIKESLFYKHQLKIVSEQWEQLIQIAQSEADALEQKLSRLKEERKSKSASLQQRLFLEYHFLNFNGEIKSLADIFSATAFEIPPSGSGECAAPKLLQYAYQNNLEPVALAEFWWGASPKSEIRKHGHFYPSCRGKCEPILGHMLKGLHVDENPLIKTPELKEELEIIYEDDFVLAINKPAEFLSVPGKTALDSVYDRIKKNYPEATGPLIVHRLDMATSGILLLTKTSEANKLLQEQFIHKTIQKRYVAVLDGVLEEDSGVIELPLRLDINDRPRQLVCFEHGKYAKTHYSVLKRTKEKTWVHFSPVTGRTHQLRVHAAHPQGLNIPILGDDLYGKRENRLHLHAEQITFMHPISKKKITLKSNANF